LSTRKGALQAAHTIARQRERLDGVEARARLWSIPDEWRARHMGEMADLHHAGIIGP
jgi:hypothetical protein